MFKAENIGEYNERASVRIEDEHIIFEGTTGWTYPVWPEDVDTQAKAKEKEDHLAQKSWMTPETMEKYRRAVASLQPKVLAGADE
ncbi:hypothetical protein [Luteibacter sp. 9135]|uniref:hypothetical protein n=1 Tax=Luteibacter sp. 9135 TaxID=1500893 RepID=UPI00055EE223|nr:hypothetical protein [Luteibacter sp. 9135]